MSKQEKDNRIKQLLSVREGLSPDAEIKPNAEKEIEKIRKIVRDLDPRLDITTEEIEVGAGNFIEVSVTQSGFREPITVFKIASALSRDGRVNQEASLSISREKITQKIRDSLEVSASMIVPKRKRK